jgi:ABC-type Fe3+-hydroxamate transport system substrate-binding protein
MKYTTHLLTTLLLLALLAACALVEQAAPEAAPAAADGTTSAEQVPGYPAFSEPPTQIELIEDRGATLLGRHAMGETETPADPQRIYSDASMLPTALTLDLNVVGAQHYPDMPDLPSWEADIAGAQVTPIVTYDFNFEEVLALDPDLIIGYGNFFWTEQDGETTYERASQIAPTIVPISDPVAFYAQTARDLATSLGTDAETVDAQIAALNDEIARPVNRSRMPLAMRPWRSSSSGAISRLCWAWSGTATASSSTWPTPTGSPASAA